MSIIATVHARTRILFPGVLVSILVALSAQFVAEHYGAPAMLMALLFGIALNFLSTEGPCGAGIQWGAKTVLRFGVALVGLRISVSMISDLGIGLVSLVILGVVATIGFGLLMGPRLGHGPRFSFLTAGSVAICGASAAMAIAAILPKDDRSEQRLVFTVVGVTLLSTIAMVLYPIIATAMGLDEQSIGVFLGATIHDVAQVVGAGFSVSEQTGETATLIKLFRVAMLAPVVVIASMVVRAYVPSSDDGGSRPPILPVFVVGFIVLAALNSVVSLPQALTEWAGAVSRWALLTSIAAVGMKTSLRDVAQVGAAAIALIVAETVFLALFVTAGLAFLPT